MIDRDKVRNKLRELGYTYKTQGGKAELWKLKGATNMVPLGRQKQLPEAAVRSILSQCGLQKEEIAQFIADAKA